MVRANWRLALYRWTLGLVPALLVLFAIALPIVVTGAEVLRGWSEDPTAWQGRAEELLAAMTSQPQTLMLALAGSFVLLCLSFLFWGFVEAGTFGTLYSSDRQAPPEAKELAWFHTLSLRDFMGWGRRYMWRYLGLLVAYLGLAFGLVLLIVGLVALATAGGRQWGGAAGFGIGCGGSLPIAFLLLASGLAYWLAAADLVREESGPFSSLQVGFRVLGRRLGAVLLLVVLWMAAMFALSLLFVVPSFALKTLLDHSLRATLTVDVVVQLVQSLAAQFVHLWFAASAVALVRSEGLGGVIGDAAGGGAAS